MPHHKEIANFLYEVGILAKTPRSFHSLLGTGKQSVAEHINRMCYIGYSLAKMEKVSTEKVLTMCLFHDISEARVSDLNYLHQKYVKRQDYKAVEDLTSLLPFGDDMKDVIEEYETRESQESLIAKDADNLELLLSLKEQIDIGNTRAESWLPSVEKRLKTGVGKQIAKAILNTKPQEWWLDPDDDWWVYRDKKNGNSN